MTTPLPRDSRGRFIARQQVQYVTAQRVQPSASSNMAGNRGFSTGMTYRVGHETGATH